LRGFALLATRDKEHHQEGHKKQFSSDSHLVSLGLAYVATVIKTGFLHVAFRQSNSTSIAAGSLSISANYLLTTLRKG
jgi:hypothetical protein